MNFDLKRISHVAAGIFLVFSLMSCMMTPPKDLECNDFIDYTVSKAESFADMLNDFSIFSLFNADWIPHTGLFLFQKDNYIRFTQGEFDLKKEPNKKYIFRSLGSGKIEAVRDLYIVQSKKHFCYSFDKINWFATDGDPREYENFVPHLNMDYDRSEGNQMVNFSFDWAVSEGENPKKYNFSNPEKFSTITIVPGMVLEDKTNPKKALDLKNKILYIPAKTQIIFDVEFDSNFMQFYKDKKNSAVFKAIEPTWLYKSGYLISISYDSKDWLNGIFSFSFKDLSSITITEDLDLRYYLKLYFVNTKLYKAQKSAGKKVPFLFYSK